MKDYSWFFLFLAGWWAFIGVLMGLYVAFRL
jgi:hypothetical protein